MKDGLGWRDWDDRSPAEVAGTYLDLLGPVESFARTAYRRVEGPYGAVLLMKPEDLLVGRILVSVCPQEAAKARGCARALWRSWRWAVPW